MIGLSVLVAGGLFSCGEKNQDTSVSTATAPAKIQPEAIYKSVKLSTDMDVLSEDDKLVLPLLIEAAQVMDELFWRQAYGDKEKLLSSIKDVDSRQYAEINYGPWDRLDGNTPFVDGIGEKPAGAQFYPHDLDTAEFNKWRNPHKLSLYTMIERDSVGRLKHRFYSDYFEEECERAAALLDSAASISEAPEYRDFNYFLKLRAEALRTDRYKPSDIAWLGLKDNQLDIIIGPIENYEDHLYGAKASYEAYVLVKDKEWSERLDKYISYLPELQKNLPVNNKYKNDEIGSEAQLAVFDVIYYAGDCNAGSKTIAVNLPNDEGLQQQYGTRRSQLKNAMKAKYDEILVPISQVLIADDQRQHITFEAFFNNTMFHEIAHGLGVKNTINGKGTVSEALRELHSPIEEGKADILGLYMITQLLENGALKEGEIMDYYVTFLAGIFRSVRFGASSAHGRANILRFNYFKEHNAFSYDPETKTYRVEQEAMREAVNSLSDLILTIQGDGDYDKLAKWLNEKGRVSPDLSKELDRLADKSIPKDIIFEQGVNLLYLP